MSGRSCKLGSMLHDVTEIIASARFRHLRRLQEGEEGAGGGAEGGGKLVITFSISKQNPAIFVQAHLTALHKFLPALVRLLLVGESLAEEKHQQGRRGSMSEGGGEISGREEGKYQGRRRRSSDVSHRDLNMERGTGDVAQDAEEVVSVPLGQSLEPCQTYNLLQCQSPPAARDRWGS